MDDNGGLGPEQQIVGVRTVIARMWTAHVVTGERGERGAMIGIYEQQGDAKAAADGKGWYGGMGDVSPVMTLTLPSGQTYLLQSSTPVEINVNLIQREKEIREQARQKLAALGLTAQERALLGITDKMLAP
ncbi:MAG: hypothetical protein EOP83_23145 [Verrucomicrobiaceae bacterium]|nr:MAG: hypothetical protein EOP83_23145 [Verrucomicrobiaceae bacterium]